MRRINYISMVKTLKQVAILIYIAHYRVVARKIIALLFLFSLYFYTFIILYYFYYTFITQRDDINLSNFKLHSFWQADTACAYSYSVRI